VESPARFMWIAFGLPHSKKPLSRRVTMVASLKCTLVYGSDHIAILLGDMAPMESSLRDCAFGGGFDETCPVDRF
jgi:hypothetical protein